MMPTAKASDEEAGVWAERAPLIGKRLATRSDRVWLKKRTKRFEEDGQLAVRGALFLSLFSATCLLPAGHLPWVDAVFKGGIYPNTLGVIMFVLTLYKSFGETMALAWGCMCGTFLAALNIWAMFAFFPGGVGPAAPPHVFYAGCLDGTAFVLLVLWLNLALPTQIFALANSAWFVSAFLAPEAFTSAKFNSGFELHTAHTLVSSLLVAAFACLLALLATLLPWPMLAIGKARRTAEALTSDTCVMWRHCVMFYCMERDYGYEHEQLVRELEYLQSEVRGLDTIIASSWWECLGLGRWQRVRAMLTRHRQGLLENHDRLCCLMSCCIDESSKRGSSELIGTLAASIRAVADSSQALYEKATAAAVSGGITDDVEEQALREGIARTRECIKVLTHSFLQAQKLTSLPELNEEQVDENAFCFNICAYGRLASELAEDLVLIRKGSKEISAVHEAGGVFSIFDPCVLFSWSQASILARSGISIILCFVVGFYGYSPAIRQHSPGIACAASVLLIGRSAAGSRVLMNLQNRIQGAVVGTVVGQLVYAIAGWSGGWWGYVVVATCVFVWTIGTLYMYYSSAKYGIIGCLLAAFGASNVLSGCTEHGFKPEGAYFVIINVVVAIFLMFAVDTLFACGRPSDLAYAAILDFWTSLRGAVDDLLDPLECATRPATREHLLGKISACASLQAEVAEEPRLWRTPWRKGTYARAIETANQLRLSLSIMEQSVAPHLGAYKGTVFRALLAMDSFERISKGLQAKLNQLEIFLKVFMHDTTDCMEQLRNPSALRSYHAEVKVAIREFVKEVMTRNVFPTKECDSLEDNAVCEISVLLASIDAMLRQLCDLQHAIVLSS